MIPFFNAMGWKIIQKKAAREEKTMDHPKYGKLVKKIVLIIKTDKFKPRHRGASQDFFAGIRGKILTFCIDTFKINRHPSF